MTSYELSDEEIEGLAWLVANTQISLSHPNFDAAVLARQAIDRLLVGLNAKRTVDADQVTT